MVQRLDPDGMLRVVAAAGPLADAPGDFLAIEQRVEEGVNGRVARTGRPAMVNDTRRDPDYLGRRDGTDPGAELSLPIVVAETGWGVLNLEQRDTGAFAEEDLLLAHVVAGQIGAAIHRCRLVGELEDAFLTTSGVISDAVEMQDSYTANHANEVADLSVRVGERLGIDGVELDRLRYAALLHDVGKDRHPGRDPPQARPARCLRARPHGRAMTSDRPYRAAMSLADAEAELRANSGTQFEPAVVTALLAELA